jgi:hypothetical protein
MKTKSLPANDDIIINDIPLSYFGTGTIGQLEIPNDLVNVDVGKNNNGIYALNSSGRMATLTVSVLAGSPDDRRLNGMIPNLEEFESTVLATGAVIKKIGDGAGAIRYITYQLAGGIVSKIPQVISAVDGNIEQALVEYKIVFGNNSRAIV